MLNLDVTEHADVASVNKFVLSLACLTRKSRVDLVQDWIAANRDEQRNIRPITEQLAAACISQLGCNKSATNKNSGSNLQHCTISCLGVPFLEFLGVRYTFGESLNLCCPLFTNNFCKQHLVLQKSVYLLQRAWFLCSERVTQITVSCLIEKRLHTY